MSDAPTRRYAELRDADLAARQDALPWVRGQLGAPPESQVRALELLGYWCELRRQILPLDVAATVAALVGSEDERVRREACATLALLRLDGAFDASAVLIDALRDPVPMVRQEAAAALGDLRVDAARAPLASGLEDGHPAVRFESAFALSALGDGSGRVELETALETAAFRAYAIEGLRRLGDPASVAPLRRVARSFFTPWPEKLAAHAVLAHFGDEDSEAELRKKAGRGRHEVRAYALYLIGHAGLTALKEVVDTVADAPRSRLRATAIQAVGALNDPGDDHRLETWLLDEAAASDVRLEALEALAARGAAIRRWLDAGRLGAPPELRRRAEELAQ